MGEAPTPYERAAEIRKLNYLGYHTMITIEPILKFRVDEFLQILRICSPVQVNIGADSGNNHLPEPSPKEIKALIEALRPFTRVHLKPNLKRLYKEMI
jgi:DNA repair photolyase